MYKKEMVIIDKFNVAMQQFLNHRIESVLYEITLQFEISDLSQSINKLLSNSNLTLTEEVKKEIVENMQDLVFDYQHNILQQVYIVAFWDGLKLESKMKEV